MHRNRVLGVVAGLVGFGMLVTGLTSATTARAAVVENIETPESGSIFNLCTNNLDTFTGVLHTIVTETFAHDGSVHLSFHVDNHDVKLYDPLLGECEGKETENFAISTPAGASTTMTVKVSLRAECRGHGDNQNATFETPVTLNPDGSVAVGSTTLSFECR